MNGYTRIAVFCAIIPYVCLAWTTKPLSSSMVPRMMSDGEDPGGKGVSVTVVGGTGFVGSRVCKLLATEGATVTSVSKSGVVPEWCKDEPWTTSVTWKAVNLLENERADLDAAIGTPEAIVSCVGVVGTDSTELLDGNGNANLEAFNSAKRGGAVQRSVLVSVASEVAECRDKWLPEYFGSYFDGKVIAENAALGAVDDDASKVCIIKPSFIYGGDSFGLLPPRVNYEYGNGVEELLSLGLFRFLADVTPGLIKVALRPPSSVDAVAAACAAAALADSNVVGKVLDGTDEINKATDQPDPTQLSEALLWVKEKLIKAYEWAEVEVPKAIEWSKTKIEESKKA